MMKHWLKIIIFILAIVFVMLITVWLWYNNQLHKTRNNPGVAKIEILEGDSTDEVLNKLVSQKLVDQYYVMAFYVLRKRVVFMPGTFAIPDKFTVPELITALKKDLHKESKFTIPEGWTKEQIADAVTAKGLLGEKFLALAKDYEGQLFPDTYNIDDKTTELDIFNKMHNQYLEKITQIAIDRNTLILASIVEREGKNDTDRPIIAGIYKNRLNKGMALQADPTVQYGKYTDLGLAPLKDGRKDYWAPITLADYSGVKSEYNTYLHPGLPPAPICNPGSKSLAAAANPGTTNAYYFIHTSAGQIITARTLDEHNLNKAKYLR